MLNLASNSQRNRSRLEEVLARKRSGKLLEVGFRKGEFLKQAQNHFQVHGIDISPYAVQNVDEVLKERVRQVDVEQGFSVSQRYDVIAAFNPLEHLIHPGNVIQSLFKGLRKGGLFVGSVPHNAGFLGTIHTCLTNMFDKTHQSTLPPNEWIAMLKQAGFKDVTIYGEMILGGRKAVYLREWYWKPLWFNMLFSGAKKV